MTVIGVKPIMLKGATFTVAADDYTSAVTQAAFIPNPSWRWMDSLTGGAFPVPDGWTRWTVSLGFIQDLATAGALSLYLIANAGERKTVTFTPTPGGQTVTADVMILPAEVGGVPNQQMTAAVSLPIFGAPVLA